MNALTDQQLLSEYAEHHSETAFAELVQRHIALVHSAACRLTNEAHSAEDVTQAVFVALARDAARLARHSVLTGWLHTTTRNLAANTVRAVVRRQAREKEAAVINQLLSSENEVPWEHVAPHLDACLGELDDAERNALLLRYFEKKSAPEMAALLGISNAAAQKRVSRAVERLRESFVQRGITVSAVGLTLAMSANAVQAAPLGLAAGISTAALAGTAVCTSTIIAATSRTIAMTTFQKTIVVAAVAVLAGTGIYEARQAARLQEQNRTLQQQQTPLVDQLQQLQSERDEATNRLAELRKDQERLKSNLSQNELLKLRGELNSLRRQADAANQRAHLAEQKLASVSSGVDQFTSHEVATINAGKQIAQAMRIFSGNNNNQYPTNIAQLKNELGGSFTIDGIDLFAFEFVKTGTGEPDHPNSVTLRERLSRQAPDGGWKRIYVFADGSVQTAASNDGNFEPWEKQNTFTPTPNQN